MSVSSLRWIRRSAEFLAKEEIRHIKKKCRGIYVLYKQTGRTRLERFDVVYVGLAAGSRSGMSGRLKKHATGAKKDHWTHFSIFEVWPNIRTDEVANSRVCFATSIVKIRRQTDSMCNGASRR